MGFRSECTRQWCGYFYRYPHKGWWISFHEQFSRLSPQLFHTRTKLDFRRGGGINLSSWSFLDICPAYTSPVSMQPVVPSWECSTPTTAHPREPAQVLGEFTGPSGRAAASLSPLLLLGSNSSHGWNGEEVSWVLVNYHRSQEKEKGGRSCCLLLLV